MNSLNSTWQRRFMDLAKFVSGWSKDPSTQVGAIITDDQNRIVSIGYNGFPRNVSDDKRLHDRDKKYKIVVHAEPNAILNAGRPVNGCAIYTWPLSPCTQCASLIIQAGIQVVVSCKLPESAEDRWKTEVELASQLFAEAGVRYILIDP